MIGRSSSFTGTRKPMWNRSFAGPRWGASGQAWSPKMMGNMSAWYDLSDTSSLVYDGSNRVSLIADKSGNSGVNCLCLNGAAGNYASAPDSVALSITGDIDVRVMASLPSWTPAALSMLVAKDDSAKRSYAFSVYTDGTLLFEWSAAGATMVQKFSTVATGIAAFSSKWVRVTLDVDNGSSGSDLKFWTSDDGTSWVQLGATVTTAGVTSIADTTSALQIGTNFLGSNRLTGNIYRAQIYNGIAGTLAFDANFALPAKLATSFTESSSNAATVTINTSGDLGARICGERDLVQMTASKRPVWLQHTGTNYAYINGPTATPITSPDSAAVSITGNIDLRVRAALLDWTPASAQDLVAKYDSGSNQRSYILQVNTSGGLTFWSSPTGAAGFATNSSVNMGLVDGSIKWVRAAANVVAGTITFYTSDDGSSWTVLGTPDTALSTGATTIFDGTAQVAVGARSDGGEPITGSIYRAQIYNGIAGTLAFDFNPAVYVSGTTLVDQSSNAATITINGGATIITSSSLYFDGTNDYMKAPAFSLSQPETVYLVGQQAGWTNTDVLMDGNAINTGQILQSTGTPQLNINAGSSVAANTGLAVATNGVLTAVLNGASSALRVNRLAATTGNAGAGNMSGYTLGASATPTLFANLRANAVLIYSAAHTTAQQNRVALAMGRQWKVAV